MSVFEAVADQTRRELMERLRRNGPATLSELSAGLPMTRQAVTKHLDVLANASLVKIRREGRTRVHVLNPAPLEEVDGWLAPYAAAWDRRLERLPPRQAGPLRSHSSSKELAPTST